MPDTLIARTYANIGEYPKAVQSAELAVGDAPTDPFMWGNYGTMLYRNQQLAESATAMALGVRGGTTPTGDTVEGIPLDYGRVAEYYYIYGLALAKLNKCSEAVEISQILLQGVPDDETAVYNANAIVIICQGGDPNAVTPDADTADTGEVTETPSP
jgi:tetratricopeptide (TPR) repeat protein